MLARFSVGSVRLLTLTAALLAVAMFTGAGHTRPRPDDSKKEEKQKGQGEGKKAEGKKAEGKKGEGKKAEGKKGEGKKGEGKKGEGKKGEGKKGDGKAEAKGKTNGKGKEHAGHHYAVYYVPKAAPGTEKHYQNYDTHLEALAAKDRLETDPSILKAIIKPIGGGKN